MAVRPSRTATRIELAEQRRLSPTATPLERTIAAAELSRLYRATNAGGRR